MLYTQPLCIGSLLSNTDGLMTLLGETQSASCLAGCWLFSYIEWNQLFHSADTAMYGYGQSRLPGPSMCSHSVGLQKLSSTSGAAPLRWL